MMTIDNFIDWVTQPVSSSQTKDWFLLTQAKMKNDVTIQLYVSKGVIAGSTNFILHEQHQYHSCLPMSKY